MRRTTPPFNRRLVTTLNLPDDLETYCWSAQSAWMVGTLLAAVGLRG